MTPLERALSKAYSRRQTEGEESRPEGRQAAARGWVSQLRAPLETPDSEQVPPAARVDLAHAGYTSRLREPASGAKPIVGARGPLGLLPAPPVETVAAAAPATGATECGSWSWPEICGRLLESPAGADLRRLAARIDALAADSGRCRVAISGSGRGAGRTALVLTLARLLVDTTQRRVLLVDAHAGHRGLAATLQVNAQGAMASAFGMTELSERLALSVPGEVAGAAESGREGLVDGFDLALIDVGPAESLDAGALAVAGPIEGFVSVNRHGVSDGGEQTARQLCQRLGARLLAVIETFAPSVNIAPPHLRRQTVLG
ncbi:MAG: hypothetical protein ACT4QC_20010 [Planctomycetaceae bacterium]